MTTFEHLAAIEEIKKLKARYFRFMDQKKWDDWAALMTEDATIRVIHNGKEYAYWRGRAEIVSKNSALNEAGSMAVHHGHMPEIEITGPTTAVGIWALHDLKFRAGTRGEAFGYYEDTYVKLNGVWKVKDTTLELST